MSFEAEPGEFNVFVGGSSDTISSTHFSLDAAKKFQ